MAELLIWPGALLLLTAAVVKWPAWWGGSWTWADDRDAIDALERVHGEDRR